MVEAKFDDILSKNPAIREFIERKVLIADPQRIESRWRSDNDIYVLATNEGNYVLKRINQPTWFEDINHQSDLSATYPGFPPQIHVRDGRSFIMDLVDGKDLLTAIRRPFSETYQIFGVVGTYLRSIYASREDQLNRASAKSQITYTLDRYTDASQYPVAGNLAKVLTTWESILENYPAQMIHNDLNTGNAMVTNSGKVMAIDPRADVYRLQDVAKDFGRLLAGITCATHSNRYLPEESLAVALATTESWKNVKNDFSERTAFYVGQSYLSFSRWDTDTLAKESLFLVGMRILEKGHKSYPALDHLAQAIVEVLVAETYDV